MQIPAYLQQISESLVEQQEKSKHACEQRGECWELKCLGTSSFTREPRDAPPETSRSVTFTPATGTLQPSRTCQGSPIPHTITCDLLPVARATRILDTEAILF